MEPPEWPGQTEPPSRDALAVVEQLRGMEELTIDDISLDSSQGRVTIFGVPDTPGVAAHVFHDIAAAGISVDMIVQSCPSGGSANMSFTVPKASVAASVAVVQRLTSSFPSLRVTSSPDVAKLSVSGIGLRSHTGVAIRMFRALAEARINVAMINTSEVRVNVVVDGPQGPASLHCLQESFADVFPRRKIMRSAAVVWPSMRPGAATVSDAGRPAPVGTSKNVRCATMTKTCCPSTYVTRPPPWQTAAEVLAIVILFFLLGGGPVPEVNEAHYLAKAKHFWNPSWCPRDFFLNSADAHYVFYLTWGWLTQWFSLAATAWIGRLAAWLLLAIAWQRLSWSLVPRWGFALLSAGIWVALLQRFHMSGEWIVGGIEAKVPAYGFVLLGLADVVSAAGRERGSGSARQPPSTCSWEAGRSSWRCLPGSCSRARERPSVVAHGTRAVLGGVLSLPGLWPALNLTPQADDTTTAAACGIYVFDRLRHHLLLSDFPAISSGGTWR